MSDTNDTSSPPSSLATQAGMDMAAYYRTMLQGAAITSVIILLAYVSVTVLLFFFEVPKESQQMATSMFNTLQTLATLAAGFWLGSSVGSMQKGAAMSVAPKAPGPP